MGLEAFVELLSKGGLLVGLIVFIWGLRQRWWVMGAEYEEMKAERDYERNQKNLLTEVADDGAKEVTKRGATASRSRRTSDA